MKNLAKNYDKKVQFTSVFTQPSTTVQTAFIKGKKVQVGCNMVSYTIDIDLFNRMVDAGQYKIIS